jgi:Ca2+-binding RTX toxin-like protein
MSRGEGFGRRVSLAALVATAGLMVGLISSAAWANHIPDATYNGSTSVGGSLSFTVLSWSAMTTSPPVSGGSPGPAATCGGKPATIVGTEGNDVLNGTPRGDVIDGLGGDDKLYGFGFNDTICGGSGNDTLNGGKSTNTLYGERGNDLIIAGAGAGTRVNPGKAFGGSGNDILKGGKGNNKLYGQVGKDTLSGGPHHDKLNGGPGKDVCNGGKGKDSASKCEVEKSI